MISLGERYLFHVHTFRCGHAEMVSDEEYIKKAIGLRATDICFTDHAPFPGNPFGGRMKYEELPEYISTLKNLKEQYQRKIKIHIGLEMSDGTLWEVLTALYFRWTCLPDCAVPELDADYRRNNRRLS